MAHDLNYNENTQRHSVFVTRQPAWHRLGLVVDRNLNASAAMEAAGLGYTVEKRPLYYSASDAQGSTFKTVPNQVGTFRTDTNEFLGVVGPSYQIVQPKTAFNFVDALMGAADGAHYETAGALGAGERMWLLARVPQGDIDVLGLGDKHLNYLLFTTSFDGSLSNQAKIVKTRVVCANTVAAAIREDGTFWKFRHTANVEAKLGAAQEAIQGVIQSSKALEAKLNSLARKPMSKQTFGAVLDRLFPANASTKGGNARRDKVLLKVIDLFESNDNNAFPEVRGTAYNLLNAYTEYVDRERGVRVSAGRLGQDRENVRAEGALFGTMSDNKHSAVAVLEEVMKDVSEVSRPSVSFQASDAAYLATLGIKL